MFCLIGPVPIWCGNSCGCSTPSSYAVVGAASYRAADIAGAVRIACTGIGGGSVDGGPRRPPWPGSLRAKNFLNQEKLSSEATSSASRARACLLRDLIIWANCPYISDRVCSGCGDLLLVSENPDIITVELGKNYLRVPLCMPESCWDQNLAVRDRPRVSVDPLDVNAPRAKGSSDRAKEGSARPGSSLVTLTTAWLRIAEEGM